MEQFWVKPKLHFGENPLEALDELKGKKVLIVTDDFLVQSGLVHRITERLTGEIRIFDEVQPDPSLQLVAQGVQVVNQFAPDVILAFGGGSPMDCAKAMGWFSHGSVPLWCVPTTAGTGSEVTSFAVLTDSEKGLKYPMVEDGLLPDVAILDHSFLAGVPPRVTAETGMDVLTHAIEAYVARGANTISDGLAEKAVVIAYQNLLKAYQGNQEAKKEMLMASTMAGIAFNSAGLGLCHSIAHSLGGQFHLPHGRLNSMLLPSVIAFNSEDKATAKKYAHLAQLCGLSQQSRALSSGLSRLATSLGLPKKIELGKNWQEQLPKVVDGALGDICLFGNPRSVTSKDVERMVKGLIG